MKTKLKIIMALFAIIPLTTSATVHHDNMAKKQCQYVIYGNGKNIDIVQANLIGIVEGISYMIADNETTSFAKKTNHGTIYTKACQNALNNIGTNGFISDYKRESARLITTKG